MIKEGFNTENTLNRFKVYVVNPRPLWRDKLSTFHSIEKNRLHN